MITIKFVPNIMEKEGRKSFELPYSRAKSLKDYLDECMVDLLKDPFEDYKVIVSGRVIENLNNPIDNNDEVTITPKIKEPVTAFLTWLGGGNLLWGIAQAAMIAYTVYSAFQTPRKPSFGTIGTGIDEGSPTYGWDGIQTMQDEGIPVPVIYGEHKVGGNIINAFIRNDGDKNYLNVLLGLSEGEIESISSVKINDNPIENFDDVTTYERMGTNSQSIISNFEDSHNLYGVGAELTKDNPHTYTTVDSDVEAFEIHLRFVGGLFQQDSSGNILDWSVTYKVEYKLHSDSIWTDLGSTTVTEKSRSTVRRVYRKSGLSAGQYDVRVTRTSDDSQLSPLKQGDLTWYQIDEIKTDDFIYPNTALLGIEALATDQLSGSMPQFSCVVKGKKISAPKVMNGAVQVDWEDYYWNPTYSEYRLLSDDTSLTWDGVTYAVQYCANPVWCIKDLLTNTRFGLGEYIDTSLINATLSVEMSQYCEEKLSDGDGGYEKRFRLDVVLDSFTKALDMISQLSTTFRGLPFYSEGTINLRIDKPETAVQLFTMGSIVKDSFSQAWKSIKDKPNVIDVQYLDKEKDYKTETISYIDEESFAAGDPIRKKTIKIFTTKTSYAIREGRYTLKQAKYINRTIAFSAGIDAVACQAGDVTSFSHDVTQWGYSGRVRYDSTTTKIHLDRNVTIELGNTYHLLVQFQDDTIEEKEVSTGPCTTNVIEVVGDPFSQEPKAYDKYSFGISTAPKKDFRIISMRKNINHEIEFAQVEYNALIYDDSVITIPTSKYSSLDLTIPNVSDLYLSENIVTTNDGTIEEAIDVWWDKPAMSNSIRRFDHVKIYLSEDNVSWKLRGETDDIYFRIQGGLKAGLTYYVKVVTVTSDQEENQLSASPYDDITLIGLPSAPASVASFSYNFDDDLELSWAKNSEKDIVGYEVRDVDNSWGVDNANLIYRGLVNSFIYQPSSRTPGTLYIKAYNTSGVYSDSASSITPTNPAPSAPSVTSTVWFGMATLDWEDSADPDIKYYEVYRSDTNAWAGEEFLVKKVAGSQANIQGNVSVNCEADSADATSITDTDLIGAGEDIYVQDYIRQVSGTYKNQVAIITAFDNSTGKVTVASWPSGTPSIGDEFTITDRAFFKVRGVDTYGPGSFSTVDTISFDPLSEFFLADGSVTTDKLANEAVTAEKLFSGEIITYSAQIKDAIITSAKIYSLTVEKLVSGSIAALIMTANNIVIDGTNDVIEVYNDSDNLMVEIGKLT